MLTVLHRGKKKPQHKKTSLRIPLSSFNISAAHCVQMISQVPYFFLLPIGLTYSYTIHIRNCLLKRYTWISFQCRFSLLMLADWIQLAVTEGGRDTEVLQMFTASLISSKKKKEKKTSYKAALPSVCWVTCGHLDPVWKTHKALPRPLCEVHVTCKKFGKHFFLFYWC